MLKYLLEKEYKQFFRSKFLPRIVLAMPFFATLIFPLVATFDVENIRLTLIDYDKTQASKALQSKILATEYFSLNSFRYDNVMAYEDLLLNQTDIILEIPEDFSLNLSLGRTSSIPLKINAVNGTRGGLGSAYLSQILSAYGLESISLDPKQAKPNLEIIPLYKYNPKLSYPVFMIPALMIMVLSMITGFLPALNIVAEKQNGSLEQLNVTPVKKRVLILSKLIPYWSYGFVVLTICLLVARFAYGLVPRGNIALIYGFATLFVLAYSGFGLVISNYAKTVQQAMFMMFFFIITFVFMSGLYTPVENMPDWAQNFSNISPLKYMMQAVRAIFLKGASIHDLYKPLKWLILMALFFNAWAIISYSKKTD